MSRIPLPAHPSPGARNTLPVPFPDARSTSPSPIHPRQSMSSISGHTGQGSIAETRRKQSKRDEAIRKKIESELSRKRTISATGGFRSQKGRKPAVARGTVAALKPSPALTVPETISVSDASQLCAAKRTDCVLVVDEEEGLCGIFTAKDLAYRVTSEGLDPRATPVSAIMTRNPMVTRDTTSATEALQLMVQRHFRHLPVCNEDGNVVGLLDITKVFHEALAKVERSSSASQKLYSALEGVQSELGSGLGANPQAAAMLAYVDALREKTALPDLTTVMDSRTQPATVGPRTTVRDAARLMKEYKTTAVCVMEGGTHTQGQPVGPARIAGIFTSKDVVLRVIAAGLEPARCSVVRVMTPHPDVAPPTMSVQDALKKMHSGHYLNLPVVEADGRLVAIIDVLKLTYATLEQMDAISSADGGGDAEGGPMWGRFFDSIGAPEDTESAISGSRVPLDPSTPSRFGNSLGVGGSPHSEVHPNDSASVVDDDRVSGIESVPTLAEINGQGASSIGGATLSQAPTVPIDDGTYVFKFRTPGGRTHRFQARNDNIENLHEIVAGKLATDPFFTEWSSTEETSRPDALDFQLQYTDADGDVVVMSSDSDVTDAVKIARDAHADRVVLVIQGGKGWDEAGASHGEAKAREASEAALKETKELEQTVEVAQPSEPAALPPAAKGHAPVASTDEIFGIPRDMVLPASIGMLAVVIVGIFTISRLSQD
ncbi:CBS-domain-containing protein [Gautieria morchelliformis]|nr:CBS-domain-containing protein [Gautieria morchelliformis]